MSQSRNSSVAHLPTSRLPTITGSPSATPETIITTTIYPNSTATIAETTPAGPGRTGPDLPIAAIAGGAAGGIILAIIAVLVWHWWGWSVRKKEDEEQKEAFAFLQLRENTRRNASSLMHNYTAYQPAYSHRKKSKKVKFVAGAPTEKALLNEKADIDGTPQEAPQTNGPVNANSAVNTTPKPSPSQPWLRRPPAALRARDEGPSSRTREAIERRVSNARLDIPVPHVLAHKSSNVSSVSAYSDQSGEEHQRRVPSTLIMAALERLDPRRPLSSAYRRSARHSAAFSTDNEDVNRLSQISAGSAYLQIPGDTPDAQIGLAH